MSSGHDVSVFDAALRRAAGTLVGSSGPDGHWVGELSSSALSTATAVFALATVDVGCAARVKKHRDLVRRGLDWLIAHGNRDGGWGDTTTSASNLSTTALVWSALSVAGDDDGACLDAADGAEAWIREKAGSADGPSLANALALRYGVDRTFSAPILTMCAIAGRLGPDEKAWRLVPKLPFELGVFSHSWLRRLHLPVVSYALPALIAIGHVRHRMLPPLNPVTHLIRRWATGPTLRRLSAVQPASGGFLEAPPLTSFVVMSLAAMGLRDHPVVRGGVDFLTRSVRADGSWPIDTNLATWVTTLSVNALADAGLLEELLADEQRERIRHWLTEQQYRRPHPYTGAAPGGWAWTDLTGGVCDADDTAGALLALRNLTDRRRPADPGIAAGIDWLGGLQNRDGGIPTFCRGWGRLPFDRSGADLTAHAIAAWNAWREDLPAPASRRIAGALARGVGYLAADQRLDGDWAALWFGNEHADDERNRTYGTARVVAALADLSTGLVHASSLIRGGAQWLLAARNDDGGWGGDRSTPSSIEETAVAVSALAKLACSAKALGSAVPEAELRDAVFAGASWLVEHTDGGRCFSPAPIGLYFARLWYWERLYPLIFTVSALGQTVRLCRQARR